MGYRVMELGAAGDGKTNDAHVIQKAIDLCSEQGGGVVIMEGGHTYLSGSIVLKSHVELVVETGAVLKASEDLNDYQYISELAKRGHDHMVEVPTFVNCEKTAAVCYLFQGYRRSTHQWRRCDRWFRRNLLWRGKRRSDRWCLLSSNSSDPDGTLYPSDHPECNDQKERILDHSPGWM